jgi:hypothetical protein
MTDVFITYSRQDQPYARALADELARRGLQTSIDLPTDNSGDLERAIALSKAFVVLMSPVSDQWEGVRKQVLRSAMEEKKPIFPVRLEGADFDQLRNSNYQTILPAHLPPEHFYEALMQAVATQTGSVASTLSRTNAFISLLEKVAGRTPAAPPAASNDVFISRSGHNLTYADTVRDELRRLGFRVSEVHGGSYQDIQRAIQDSRTFIIIMSPAAERSRRVQSEISLAKQANKPIFPLMVEGQTFASLRDIQPVDVRGGRLPPRLFFEHLAQLTHVELKPLEAEADTQDDRPDDIMGDTRPFAIALSGLADEDPAFWEDTYNSADQPAPAKAGYVFLSHSSVDKGFIQKLAADLRQHGYEVWLDIDNITADRPYWEHIQDGIEGCTHFLFAISPDSLKEDCHARTELFHAAGRKPRPKIVPVMVRAYPMNELPMVITPGMYHILDFTTGDYDATLTQVLKALG